MASIAPYFYLAFSNPKGDLDALDDEITALENLLFNAKENNGLNIEYHFQRKCDTSSLKDKYKFLEKKPLALFHFSGHANESAIAVNDSTIDVEVLIMILKLNKIKIVFLNACATEGMVEDIFNHTNVEAIIATNKKVSDITAKDVSISFYTEFLKKDCKLIDAFNRTTIGFSSSTVKKSAVVIERDLVSNKIKKVKEFDKLNHQTKFSWGLFVNNNNILNCSINDLISESVYNIEKITLEIENLNKEYEKLLKVINALKLAGDNDTAIEFETKAVLKQKEINEKVVDLMNAQISKTDKNISNEIHNKSTILDNAIKTINYKKQVEHFDKINSMPFGACSFMGDKYSYIELLNNIFNEEIKLTNEDFHLNISFSSSTIDTFWNEISRYVGLENETKEATIEKLIKNHFFGETHFPNKTHKHIIIKLNVSKLDVENIKILVTEFWKLVADYLLTNNLPLINAEIYSHKLIIVFYDKESNEEKIEYLNNWKIQNKNLIFNLEILPKITPLEKIEINDWIYYNNLSKIIDVKTTDTDAIYQNTNGNISEVLKFIKSKAKAKNISLSLLEQLD